MDSVEAGARALYEEFQRRTNHPDFCQPWSTRSDQRMWRNIFIAGFEAWSEQAVGRPLPT